MIATGHSCDEPGESPFRRERRDGGHDGARSHLFAGRGDDLVVCPESVDKAEAAWDVIGGVNQSIARVAPSRV